MGFGVESFRVGLWGLGFGFRVSDFGCWFNDSIKLRGLWFMVQGLECQV